MASRVALLLVVGTLSLAADPMIWPLPQKVENGAQTLDVDPSLVFVSTGHRSPILLKAYSRYLGLIFSPKQHYSVQSGDCEAAVASVSQVTVKVTSSDETLHYGTDESYSMTITSTGNASITATTVYGAMYGLETFSQLVVDQSSFSPLCSSSAATHQIPLAPWSIKDSPRFAWRGILLDTSRWYYPVEDIKRTLDAMSYNKMNVFHWHVTDAQSFPIVSETYPELSAKGAYSADQVYTQAMVKDLIGYGHERGIRILPEFDSPGHTTSWGKAFPELVVCADHQPWGEMCNEPPCGQLNPLKPEVYEVLDGLLGEFASLFPDAYMHVGADEVDFKCWDSDEGIAQYKKDHGVDDTYLLQTFEDRKRTLVYKHYKKPISWEEVVLDFKLNVPTDVILQAWKGEASVSALANQGYQVVASPYTAWYLDCGTGSWLNNGSSWCDPYKTWQTVYDYEPTTNVRNHANVIGGEAAIWSETIDSANVDAKLWPRASAAAERLWSDAGVTSGAATSRINNFRQLLVSRGIRARPLQPQWCVLNPGECR